MSAEELGRRLLDEVEEEGLDELLKSLRSSHAPNEESVFNIKALDELLRSASLHRHGPIGANKGGPTLEICSKAPGAGKSHLLYLIVTLAILPPTWDGVDLLGFESAVVFIDADGRFDVQRLVEMMQHFILTRTRLTKAASRPTSANEGISDVNIERKKYNPLRALSEVIRPALQHIHLFRPQSRQSQLAALVALPDHLFDQQAHSSTDRRLHSIIIDSASAFAWAARAEDQDATLQGQQPSSTTPSKSISAALSRLQMQFECALIWTSWQLFASKRSNEHNEPVQHTAASLVNLQPSLRLTVGRNPVSPFPPRMTYEEAMNDRQARQCVVEKGEYYSRTDNDAGGFRFCVTEDGVDIE